MNRIPVIIHHEGNQEYLKTCVRHNARFNRVILFGDESNKYFANEVGIEWVDCNALKICSRLEELNSVLVNLSFYPDKWVYQFYGRLVLIEEYLKDKNVDKFILFDSDILGFTDVNVLSTINKYDAGFCTCLQKFEDLRWVSNIGISFFSREALSDFIDFIILTYKENKKLLLQKWNYHKQNNIPGGVCEMSLAYLWQNVNTKYRILNTTQEFDSGMFDFNVGSSENYEKNEFKMNRVLGIKKIVFDNGTPNFVRTNGEEQRVHALHCLGMAKHYMTGISNCKHNIGDYVYAIYYFKFRRIVQRGKNFRK